MSEYISFVCRCKKEFILISEEARYTIEHGKYLSCPHCGSRAIKEVSNYDSIKECINHSSYKKVKGAIRQVRT